MFGASLLKVPKRPKGLKVAIRAHITSPVPLLTNALFLNGHLRSKCLTNGTFTPILLLELTSGAPVFVRMCVIQTTIGRAVAIKDSASPPAASVDHKNSHGTILPAVPD